MNELPRVRHHTDGRTAIHVPNGYLMCWFSPARVPMWLTDEEVSGEGWSDLLIAELPVAEAAKASGASPGAM